MTDFERHFGQSPDVAVSAPGRVNLIGEHTDYNGGLVLPTALRLATRVQMARRGDRRVRCVTTTPPYDRAPAEYGLGGENRTGAWSDHVQAVTHVLAQAGHEVPGVDVHIESDLPAGGGLASSAALMVALLRGFRALAPFAFDDLTVARLAHRGETGFVNSPVGIMDPVACSLGDPHHALLIDTRSLHVTRVPLPADAELALVDSGLSHQHAIGAYRVRRAECEAAARLLNVEWLTDLGLDDLARCDALPEPLGRRARHVITEQARVPATARALQRGELEEAGALFYASHESMRRDFGVSLPAIDLIVELAWADPRVYGARLTGGGFGGAVVLLCHAGAGMEAARAIVAAQAASARARVLMPAALAS